MSISLLYHLVGLRDSTQEAIGHTWTGILKAVRVLPKAPLAHSRKMYSCDSHMFQVSVCSIEESALSS